MRLSIYIDKQDNSKRKCFRLRVIDLDSNFSIDKSISFSTKKEATRVSTFLGKILSLCHKEGILWLLIIYVILY